MPDPAAAVADIWAAYKAAEPARGIVLGRAAVAENGEHGEAWYALACCLERAGDELEADRCFGRAARCHEDPQARPFRVPWRRFQRLVDDAGAALPEKLRGALGEVTLVLADYAEPELIEEHDDPELLGLFVGSVRAERLSPPPGSLSPRIYLFRRAHEHATQSSAELADEVRQTLWHELGHYLGYGEEGLEDLGMD